MRDDRGNRPLRMQLVFRNFMVSIVVGRVTPRELETPYSLDLNDYVNTLQTTTRLSTLHIES